MIENAVQNYLYAVFVKLFANLCKVLICAKAAIYNDGLWYEGWEGHFDLVKLNLNNPQVVDHILECITNWVKEFDIDGLRLDVAYCLDKNFLKHSRCIPLYLHQFSGPN